MTTVYQIDEDDFVTHQLFAASRSASLNKKRKKMRLLIPIIYACFGLLGFIGNNYFMAVGFWIFAALWFFFYPLWIKHRYQKHYRNYVREHYKDRIGNPVSVELNDEYILAKSRGIESKVLTTEVEGINEIPSAIFVLLKNGQSFIFPKNKIAEMDTLTLRLKELANQLKVGYELNEKWEWK